MILIANSIHTRTEWALVDQGQIIDKVNTTGINPYFQTRREMSHIIRLELPERYFRTKIERVYFYGSGCANPEKNKTVESSIVAQFRTPASVHSDLLGAAHGLLIRQPGLACIMSVGTNSCFYDGSSIVKNVRAGGFILGDEGSSSYMGKKLVADIVKEIAPRHICLEFYSRFHTNVDEVLDLVYTHPRVTNSLAMFSSFLHENLDEPYCHELVKRSFEKFFKRNIAAYDYQHYSIAMVGAVAVDYKNILEEVAQEFGARISKIVDTSLSGLVEYHSTQPKTQD